MKRLLDPRCALVTLFLGVLAGVPLVQAWLELREGAGVRALELFERPPTAAHLRDYERRLEEANWAAHWSRPWLQNLWTGWFREGGARAVVAPGGWYFFRPGLLQGMARPSPGEESGGVQDAVAAIVDFRDQLESRGMHLLLVPVPDKESVYPDRVTSRVDSGAPRRAARFQRAHDRLRASGVEVVDLLPIFGEARRREPDKSGPPVYLAQDTHWSPEGMQLAAAQVARRVAELGWLAPGRVEYRTEPVSVERVGDIVRMLRSPPLEARVGAERVSAQRVLEAESGRPYTDDAQSEVLLMGDSFLRVYQSDAPGAAGFPAHLGRSLGRPVLSLINDGGGATLVREELRARPAFLEGRRVVVWVFVERDFALAVNGWPKVRLE